MIIKALENNFNMKLAEKPSEKSNWKRPKIY